MRRVEQLGLAACFMVVATFAMPAAPALATPAAPAAAAGTGCLNIGLTTEQLLIITGYGSSACDPHADIKLTIQRSRWWGWEDLETADVAGPGYDQYVHYNCAGTGVHDFRTIIWNGYLFGTRVQKASNVITVDCGG